MATKKDEPPKAADPAPANLPAAPASTAVTNWEEELGALAVQTAQVEKPSSNWFSFKGGVMVLNGVAMKGNKVECVILASAFENQLYKDKYDPNNHANPICYAISEDGEDMVPHPDSLEKQSETCDTCPHNAWGSDPGGGKGKACKNVRRLAVISATDLGPDLSKVEVALAKLSVTNTKNWATYASQIANVLKLPPLAVKTEMSVEPDAKTVFQVNFSLLSKIEDKAHLQALLNKRRDVIPLILAPYDKSPPKEAATASGPKKF